MVRIKYYIVIALLLFLAACRNSPVEVSDDRGELSVTASIDRSLYSGTSLPGGRFIDLSSDSITLTCTIDETDYTATVTLEADPENPDKYIGTATISDLPVDVTAAVNVQTHNADSVLICEGSDSVELTEGENSINIKLKISPDSPFLMAINPSEYSFTTIPVGESRFFTVGPLTAGTSYEFFGDSVDDVDGNVILNLVSQTGELIAITENANESGFSFTATDSESYAIACYYNSGTADINGVAWWNAAGNYTKLVETNRIDTSASSLTTYITAADASSYRSIAADNGRFYMAMQYDGEYIGYYAYTDDGSNWTVFNSESLFDSSITTLGISSGIPNIVAIDDYVLLGSFYKYYLSPNDALCFTMAIRDKNGIYDHTPSHPSEIEYDITSTLAPYNNSRISYSGTHSVLASIDESSNLHIGMSETVPGSVGSFNPASVDFSSEIGTADNMQIASSGNTCYILGNTGAVYSYQAGGSSLSSPLFTISADTNTFRHLGLYKSNYLVTSSPLESSIYIPENGTKIPIYDATNPSPEIQTFIDQGVTFNFHLFSSENYLVLLEEVQDPSGTKIYYVLVSENGGFSWIMSNEFSLGTGTMEKVEVAVDESFTKTEIYLGLTVDIVGTPGYELKTFQLQ